MKVFCTEGWYKFMKEERRICWKEDLERFEECLRERENAAATVEKYIRDIGTFHRYLGDCEVIDKGVLLHYKQWLQENYSVSSANSTTTFPSFAENELDGASYKVIDTPTGLTITGVTSVKIGDKILSAGDYTASYDSNEENYTIDLSSQIGNGTVNAGKAVMTKKDIQRTLL